MTWKRLRYAAGVPLRWLRILAARRPSDGLHVSYGQPVPGRDTVVSGGLVKFQRLAETFPHRDSGFNVLYLGSNTLPPDWRVQIALARAKGASLVWNQNGVAYPAWHGPGWQRVNAPMKTGLHRADHVFFQSDFCRVGAERYLGARPGRWEILHNAVDTTAFTPAPRSRDGRLVLLLGGNQYQRYRIDRAVRTLALLADHDVDAQLLVTGRLSWLPDEEAAKREAVDLARSLGVLDRVELTGPYVQADAPDVLRRADLLLHTKYNDPCPSLVVEAMACGLPVVYSASGGVPELVGAEAGIGVPAPLDWESDHPPDPERLAEAVARVADRLDDHREAARRRAVDHFDLGAWRERHREVFEELTA
jgi:glycosyltransferase involved in cell wall biosynthesis